MTTTVFKLPDVMIERLLIIMEDEVKTWENKTDKQLYDEVYGIIINPASYDTPEMNLMHVINARKLTMMYINDNIDKFKHLDKNQILDKFIEQCNRLNDVSKQLAIKFNINIDVI